MNTLQFANERRLPVLFIPGAGGAATMTILNADFGQISVSFFIGHSLFGDWAYVLKIIKETPDNCYLEPAAIPGELGTSNAWSSWLVPDHLRHRRALVR